MPEAQFALRRNSSNASGIELFVDTVQIILLVVRIYVAVGIGVGILSALWGLNRIDDAARDSTIGFRVLIIPGITVLWPMILTRWLRSRL